METPGERLSQYIENKGYTKKEFCEMAGLAYNNFVRVLNGTRPLGINVLDKVKSVLTNLNVNWLLYNEGSAEVHTNLLSEPDADYRLSQNFEGIVKQIIKNEVDSRFESVNKNIYILMKRSASEKSNKPNVDKKSS